MVRGKMLQVKEPTLLDRILSKDAIVGICGLGYVGLPLALTFGEKGFAVLGFDIDARKVDAISRGESYIKHIPGDRVAKATRAEKAFAATLDFRKAAQADVLIICVPTPLNANREPDMTYIENTATAIGPYVRPGQLDRAGELDVSRHHRRGGEAHPGIALGIARRRRLLPRLLPGARGSGQPELQHRDDPQGGRRLYASSAPSWPARSTRAPSPRWFRCRARGRRS